MLADVQAHFGLARPFHRVGNYETEHQRALVREVCAVVQTGRLVVVAGLVGSGKTHLLTRIEEELARSSKIAVAKSLAVDKRRTSLPSLIEAMFYDLTPGDRSKVKIPKQPERRERELRDLMRKNKHPVVLIVDEAHELHHQTLTGFKRLMEMAAGAGVILSVLLIGHPEAAQRPSPAADGGDRLPHHDLRVRGRVRQPPRVHRLAAENLRAGRRRNRQTSWMRTRSSCWPSGCARRCRSRCI